MRQQFAFLEHAAVLKHVLGVVAHIHVCRLCLFSFRAEEILQALELPYRVIELCAGDLASWKHRSCDLEVWRPTTNSYGEVMSLSNCTDYQARKLNIKVISKDGSRRVVHTLNNTALATSRIIVAILENFQTKAGTIKVPKALWPYMGRIKEIKKKEIKEVRRLKK